MISGITGAHNLLYSDNAEADRAFFRDALEFRAVDAGGGWLIFALPEGEAGIHPSLTARDVNSTAAAGSWGRFSISCATTRLL